MKKKLLSKPNIVNVLANQMIRISQRSFLIRPIITYLLYSLDKGYLIDIIKRDG